MKDLAVGGKDVMEHCGISPSPKVGEILNALLSAVIDEEIENEKSALLKFAESFS